MAGTVGLPPPDGADFTYAGDAPQSQPSIDKVVRLPELQLADAIMVPLTPCFYHEFLSGCDKSQPEILLDMATRIVCES
jgi:hypothetical protein